MYKNLRIKNSYRPTPVPWSFKAYIFGYHNPDGSIVYKVILAPSKIIAWQRIRDWSSENDVDFFWFLVSEDDFEVVYSNNVPESDLH